MYKPINKWKIISVGLLYKDNKVLLGLRYPKNSSKQIIWEFPGGSIEQGESPEESMIREMKEELNISVTQWEFGACLCDHKKDVSYMIIFHHILDWEGEIEKTCHQEFKWISLAESKEQKIPNINPLLFEKIHSLMSQKIK